MNDNYCDSGEAYKAIFYYKPLGCAPMPTVTELPDEIMTSPSDLFTINTDRQVSSSYDVSSSAFRHFNSFSTASLCLVTSLSSLLSLLIFNSNLFCGL